MKIINKHQVMLLHEQLIRLTGGTQGIRDEGLLESALAAPFQSFAGQDVYPTLWEKAARLGYGVIKNHPYLDGNKRSGAHAMLVFLALNGIDLKYTQQELADTIVRTAAGELPFDGLTDWLKQHAV